MTSVMLSIVVRIGICISILSLAVSVWSCKPAQRVQARITASSQERGEADGDTIVSFFRAYVYGLEPNFGVRGGAELFEIYRVSKFPSPEPPSELSQQISVEQRRKPVPIKEVPWARIARARGFVAVSEDMEGAANALMAAADRYVSKVLRIKNERGEWLKLSENGGQA